MSHFRELILAQVDYLAAHPQVKTHVKQKQDRFKPVSRLL